MPLFFRNSIVVSCALLFPLLLSAQLSPYYSHQQLYDEAIDLFEKDQYGPAQQKIQEFLDAEGTARGNQHNDLHANARFIEAASAFYLERTNAEAYLKDFLRDYGANTKATQVNFLLGKLYFDKKDFLGAIRPLLAAYQTGNLSADKMDELTFLLAYSYFMDNQNEQAARYFSAVGGRQNPFQEDARYYLSVILYQDRDYEGAYLAFKELEKSPKYGKEIRVYLANTLLKLKRYDELYVLADELITDRRLRGGDIQVYYVVANASFEREDFPRTVEYFGQYTQNKGRMNKADQFRFGYAYYKMSQYAEAIPVLKRALGGADSLEQVSSYYLGFCYLEEKDEPNARFAFKKASEQRQGNNSEIAEDALYQFAKVSFATENYSEAIDAFSEITNRYPRASYIPEVQAMMGEAFLYTRNYPKSIAYFESIPRTTNRIKQAYQLVCYYFGIENFERGAYPAAEESFQKAVANSFDVNIAQSAQYWTGESLYRRGDFPAARLAFQTYLSARNVSQNEYYAQAYYGIAWTHFKEKSYASALKNFEDFLAKGGRSADKNLVVDAYLRSGDSEFLQRKYTESNRYYQRVLDFRYTYQDYAQYQIAESQYRLRQYQNSVKEFDKLITTYRTSELRDNALDRISEIYLTWLGNEAQASRYSKMLVQDYPRSPLAGGAYNRLAIAAFNAGDANGAINYFKKVLQDYASDKTNAQIALENLSALLSPDEFDKVFRDYRASNPDLDNSVASIAFNTGKDRFFSMNYASAIEQFSIYIRDFKNGPDYFEALLFRARSYVELNQTANALQDYQTIYSTPSVNAFTPQALVEAAEIRFDQKEYMSSLQLFKNLNEISGNLLNKVQALFGMARAYTAMQDYQQAITTLNLIASNNEVTTYSRTQAQVGIGNNQYLAGALAQAKNTFAGVERDFKNEFGAESQHMLVRILYDEALAQKASGDPALVQGKFERVKEAGLYQKNTYPTYNLWNARTFLIVAEANYQLGESFQAMGVLESLINEAPYPDIVAQAKKRLAEMQAEESRNDPTNPNGN